MEELEYKLEMMRKIVDVTNKLDANLNEMRKLEIEGHRDSPLYHSYLLRYVVMKEVEDDYYRKLNLDIDTYMMFSDMMGVLNMMGSLDDIIYTWQGDYLTAPNVRILKRLKEEAIRNCGRFDYSIPSDDYDFYNSHLRDMGVELADFMDIDEKFYNNVAMAYTYFLDEDVKRETDPKKREMLINAKYNMIMINKEVEKGFWQENMDIEYLDKEQEAFIMDIPREIYIRVINHLCENDFDSALSGMKSNSLYAMDNSLIYPLLRAYLVNMSYMGYRMFDIERDKHIGGNVSMNLLRDVDSIIRNGKEDRKKVKVIKFA